MKRVFVSLLLVLTMVASSICYVGAAEVGSIDWFKGKFESSDSALNSNVETIDVPVKIEVKLNGADAAAYGASLTTTKGKLVDLRATLDMSAVKNLVAGGKVVLSNNYTSVKDYPVTGLFVIKTNWKGILEEDTVENPLATGNLAGFKFDGIEGSTIFAETEARTFDEENGKNVGVTAKITATTTVDGVVEGLPNTITLEHTGLKVINFGNILGDFTDETFTKVDFGNDDIREVKYNFKVTPAAIKRTGSGVSGGSSGGGVSAVTYPVEYVEDGKTVVIGNYNAGKEITLNTTPDAKEGKVFLGWATTAGGEVVYKYGDTLEMPKAALTLYPVWGDQPSLNKEEHFAYIKGYPDGTVRPEANISREEVATIFFRLLSAETKAIYLTEKHSFADVEVGRWSNDGIATLANAGIIKGRTKDAFAPEEAITRAEFATIAARFDSEDYTSSVDMFNDITGHWAADYINRAAARGWVTGDGNGEFRPDDYITRAEAATLINRVLGRSPESAEDLIDAMIKFADNADVDAWYYLNVQEASNGHTFVRKEDGKHESWVELFEFELEL